MDAITLMMEEHKYIKRGLAVIRKMSIAVLNGEEVPYEDFGKIIQFVRNYADKHHHNKEEEILFEKMKEQLGEKAVEAPLSGMYIEHDLGRLFMKTLEEALERVKNGDKDSRVDVIANAVAYTDLLHRHIDREDNALYTFAKRSLKEEALRDLDAKCEAVEKTAEAENLQQTYIDTIKELETKWN
jgi:hemerythrin-like domain-containing protein